MAAKKGATGSSGSSAHPVTVQVSPPAYQVRKQAGLQIPSGKELYQALGGAAIGVALSAVMLGVVPPDRKWIVAGLTLIAGGLAAATSPIGTITQEIGLGSFAASTGWIVFDVTNQYPSAGGG